MVANIRCQIKTFTKTTNFTHLHTAHLSIVTRNGTLHSLYGMWQTEQVESGSSSKPSDGCRTLEPG